MLYLVRHGSAGTRDDRDPHDTERHLDAAGLRQAVAVAERLSEAEVTAVVTSPAARCVETVEPLASAAGVEVVVDDRLFEGTDIDHAWQLIEDLIDHGEVAVLCSHGDLIPEILRRAKGRGMEVPGKWGCSKGSLWSLEWDGDRFATGRYESQPLG